MPASPDQLEQDIAATRDELARTLSELEHRMNPRAIVRRNRVPLVVVAGAVVVVMALGVRLVFGRH